MATWSTRTTYQGKSINEGTKQILAALNKMVRTKALGGETSNVTMVQGGYNKGGVAASAGTHDGGGAFDLTPHNWKNRVKALRLLGCASSHRTTIKGVWSEHIHTIVCGDGTASAGALAQVKSYYKGRNGLANNAKDTDWRPHGLPILFRLDGDLAPRYAIRKATARDSPSIRGKVLATLAKGDSLTPVAVIKNYAGNLWFVTADGRCGYEKNFTTTKPTTKPKPEPPQADHVSLHLGTLNVSRWRITAAGKNYTASNGLPIRNVSKGKSWASRVKLIPAIRKQLALSILCTNESGQYVDGNLIDKYLGSKWANILHGDEGDLTNAIHYDKVKRKVIAEGSFATSGPSHKSATWVLFEDIKTGIRFMLTSSHLLDSGSGTNAERLAQAKAWIKGAEAVAKTHGGVPIIYIGDVNADRLKDDDGPGKAFTATKRYSEVDLAASSHVHGDWSTINHLAPKPVTGRRVDRAWVSKALTVGQAITVFGAPATDHNGIGFLVSIPR